MIKIQMKKEREGSINPTKSSSDRKAAAHISKIKNAKEKASHLCSNLPHGVSVPQSRRVRGLVHGVEVNGDAKSHANLIGPGVASSNRPRGVVYFVRDAVPRQGFRCPKYIKSIKHEKRRKSQCPLNVVIQAQET